MKKIIWIAHEANLSGANHCLLEFISLLNKQGFSQILVLPHKGNMERLAETIGVRTKIIHFYDWIRPLSGSFLTKNIFKRILRNAYAFISFCYLYFITKPNIICTNTIVNGVGAIAAKVMFKTHIWFIHEMGEEDFGFKLSMGKFSFALMNFLSKKFLINSVFVARKFERLLPSDKFEIIYNPVLVDLSYKPSSWKSNSPLLLIMLGQVSAIKGHIDAIKAVKILKDNGFNTKLNIYGRCEHPAYMKELLENIDNFNLSNSIQIMGPTENPSQIITQHHILLICSIYEAMGRVSLEAMKLGVFVIGSDIGGTTEIVIDNKTGYLYNQGDPESLAQRIMDFIIAKNRSEIILNAKEHANSLTKNGIKYIIDILNK